MKTILSILALLVLLLNAVRATELDSTILLGGGGSFTLADQTEYTTSAMVKVQGYQDLNKRWSLGAQAGMDFNHVYTKGSQPIAYDPNVGTTYSVTDHYQVFFFEPFLRARAALPQRMEIFGKAGVGYMGLKYDKNRLAQGSLPGWEDTTDFSGASLMYGGGVLFHHSATGVMSIEMVSRELISNRELKHRFVEVSISFGRKF